MTHLAVLLATAVVVLVVFVALAVALVVLVLEVREQREQIGCLQRSCDEWEAAWWAVSDELAECRDLLLRDLTDVLPTPDQEA